MQAIILAAGMGKRLREYTIDNTKCMVPVNGVPMIDRMLCQLEKLNLNRIVIVVGYQGENLKNHIALTFGGRLPIEYVDNPIYFKTNNIYSLALAKDKMVEDDTLLIESDLMLDEKVLPLIVKNPYPNLALVAKYQTWMDGTMVKIDSDCNIVNFVPKQAFKYSETDSYYKTVNVYKFSRDFSAHKYVPFLEAYCEALGNNEYYEQVLRVICMLNNSELKALPLNDEKWYESDDKADIDVAEAIFSEKEEKYGKISSRFGGFWRFPEMTDFCYLVNPFFPTEKMKDELRSNFDVLLTQYPSGMRVNSLLASKCFGLLEQHIVPGNGAAELIKSLMSHLLGRLGVICPTFEEYPNRRGEEDLVIFRPESQDFHYSAEDLIEFFSADKPDNLLIINPDNPSGNLLSGEELLALARWCSRNAVRLVLDESFVDFASDELCPSFLTEDFLQEFPDAVVLKSISKSFGVPGLRLGVMASYDEDLIRLVKKDVSIWNINSFAEFFMQIFNKHEADYRAARVKFMQERDLFFGELSQLSCLEVIPSHANYFLCRVKDGFTAGSLSQVLLNEYNVLIKDCSGKKGFDGRDYVRIAVRDRADNSHLASILKSLEGSI